MPDETQEPRTERASIAHRLKVWPSYYAAVADGRKPFEVRRDDRVPAFRTGDTLLLCEWDPATEQYTGRAIERRVTYCLRRAEPWVPDGYVVMGLAGDEYHAQPGNAPVSEREEGESRTRGRTPMPDETQEREASHATVLVVLDHAVEMLRRSPRGEREATAYQVAADNVQAAMREQEVAIDRLTRERDALVDELCGLFGRTDRGYAHALLHVGNAVKNEHARFEEWAREADLNRQSAGPGVHEHAVDLIDRLADLVGPGGTVTHPDAPCACGHGCGTLPEDPERRRAERDGA